MKKEIASELRMRASTIVPLAQRFAEGGLRISHVEDFFLLRTERALKRGVFGLVAKLEKLSGITSKPQMPIANRSSGPRLRIYLGQHQMMTSQTLCVRLE
ncbi:hypothetical protein [Rhodopseudomonas sp. RCAM05734]|uniref:hypothetical protein n=1 Tax=Rhodopseudomonas sp. RCAM05734 TaxID=3457549 RepID=UPI0040450E63